MTFPACLRRIVVAAAAAAAATLYVITPGEEAS